MYASAATATAIVATTIAASSFLLWTLDNASVMQQRGCINDNECECDEGENRWLGGPFEVGRKNQGHKCPATNTGGNNRRKVEGNKVGERPEDRDDDHRGPGQENLLEAFRSGDNRCSNQGEAL